MRSTASLSLEHILILDIWKSFTTDIKVNSTYLPTSLSLVALHLEPSVCCN
jgi:hypothetical protein